MEQYPSIENSSKAPFGQPCIAFYKYDGSNLRWEWNPKKGWFKFGTRTQLFDQSDEIFGETIPLFMKMGDEIVRRVKSVERQPQRITAFTEFFGPSSFTGSHIAGEPKELRLFDVYLFKRGLMKPRQFVKVFGDLPYSAEVVYEGNLNKQFIEDIREGRYPVWEGVVCKGDDWMCKIKTKAYFAKLSEVYGRNIGPYWE
jgi:hypothetical protein